ncbi:ArsR/SmtB family transcription factor [Streptomyces luteolus]|uniref:Winged helix-turn-helix domain-containing protein n=1 Tax=Streptomyces luteolus TaxID=3043615 RepID=A0ABT6SRT5_9ACTN|nr:winged helix-turn-helix domain-containing protein [Streptomyces sp. B-S-A12]MDI3417833.1 winged helix-turn-helix domain-containing protein [Streptomyces sp. B-S-A12]
MDEIADRAEDRAADQAATDRTEPELARAARLLASPSRARMLKALSDGRPLAVTVLAAEAGVSVPTASVHLTQLAEAGLVHAEHMGRHRYFRLASADVAAALEALAVIAPPDPAPMTTLRAHSRNHALRRSRTCYDHLAGSLGVALMGAFLDQGLLREKSDSVSASRPDQPAAYGRQANYHLTSRGSERFAGFGIDVAELVRGRRPAVRYCVDWSERRHHLAGALGAGLAARFFDLDWLRYGISPRVVHLTDVGKDGVRNVFAIDIAD